MHDRLDPALERDGNFEMHQETATEPKINRFAPEEWDEAAAALRRDGVAIFDEFFPSRLIKQLRRDLEQEYPSYIGLGKPADFLEVGNRRFVSPLRYAEPFDCKEIVANQILDKFLSNILGDSFVYEAYGVTTSLAGASEQNMHRDGGVLFGETGLDQILPPSAVTIVIPLVDMDSTSGSTTFWPGTHRFREAASDVSPIAEDIPVGSMAIWDFRIQHAGQANHGSIARPLLYFTACRPFWLDHKNFVEGRNAKLLASKKSLDRLEDKLRKRFSRAKLTEK